MPTWLTYLRSSMAVVVEAGLGSGVGLLVDVRVVMAMAMDSLSRHNLGSDPVLYTFLSSLS
jgi:hypothetical protein